MKKINLLIALFFISSTTLFASSIDVNYAMQVAKNFYWQTTGKTFAPALAYQYNNTDATNGVPVGQAIYYVFNMKGNNGFVIVSADDLAKPILGYSTRGQFLIQNAPGAITDWLAKYTREIAYAKTNFPPGSQAVATQWNNYYNNVSQALRSSGAVGPLLTTSWDQDLYYNADCPQDASSPEGYGGNVPTGCGATAMAQIMRYWSSPTQGAGSNSYTSNYGTLSANFGAATYNWANMPNSVTSANPDVATLMFDCGVAVDMVYGPNESSSYICSGNGIPASCQQAYTTYFAYNVTTIQGLQRANYNESDWVNLIQNELNNNRPIQYAGQGPDGGHTFVLDGSDVNGNFHINWGWSGSDNGFYSIDALDPAPTPNGTFDEGEQMLIGIEPTNVAAPTTGIDLFAATVVAPDPITFDQTFTVTTNVINFSGAAFNGSFCAALFDSTGNFIRYIGYILSTNGQALPDSDYYENGLTFSDTTQQVTVPGSYTIGIYYLASNATRWQLAGADGFTNPITVTISGPANTDIIVYSDIIANPSTLIQGQPATVSVNLANFGQSTFYGTYEVVLLDLYGNLIEGINTYTESIGLPMNDDYTSPLTFSTSSITAAEGQYILAVAEEDSGTTNWYYCGSETYQNPVVINVINNGFEVSIHETPSNNVKIYPNPASNQIFIDAGNAEGNYTLKIFNMLGQEMNESEGVLNGQKLSADVSAYSAGIYVIQLKTGPGTMNAKFTVK